MHYHHRRVPRSVFRACDIRGVVARDLDEHAFYTIGCALGLYLHQLQRTAIYLGRDGRLTSLKFSRALTSGLLEQGIHVYDLGVITTPVMYFASHTQAIDCGLMVTGSHNPPDYNGLKIVLGGKTLVRDELEKIYHLLHQVGNQNGTTGAVNQVDLIPLYQQAIVERIQIQRPLKVVVDCANGAAGPIVPKVLQSLGCVVVPLYCDVDGHFPHHHPDPAVPENMQKLIATVQEHNADLGLAFDGDADRLGVITNQGEIIWPDRLMILYAQEILARHPAATIVYDVKCTQNLRQRILMAGGKPKMCPTGHSLVKQSMLQEEALLAGEMSGHIFFQDRWFGFDDALYSACRLLEILGATTRSSSQLFSEIPEHISTPELKIPLGDERKFLYMERFKRETHFPQARLVLIDGVRAEYPWGWGLIRASNTTPNLVVRFEAQDQASLKRIQDKFRQSMLHIDADLAVPF